MTLIVWLLLIVIPPGLLAASGYALTRLHRPKLAAILAVVFVVALIIVNRLTYVHSVSDPG